MVRGRRRELDRDARMLGLRLLAQGLARGGVSLPAEGGRGGRGRGGDAGGRAVGERGVAALVAQRGAVELAAEHGAPLAARRAVLDDAARVGDALTEHAQREPEVELAAVLAQDGGGLGVELTRADDPVAQL